MKKKYYSWDDVNTAAVSIAMQMYKDGWRPDYIVGITRGGLPLATILSHLIDCRMETLKVKFRNAHPDESCETNCWMSEDAFGYVDEADRELYKSRWDISRRKKILIVDDINDTGVTFEWIKKDWQSGCLPNETDAWNSVWSKSVRFAVMTENLSSNFEDVNYYYDEVNTAQWIVFPWENDNKKGE